MRAASTKAAAVLVALVALLSTSIASALGEGSDGTLGVFGGRDPRVFYAAETEERVVALTIDDAPDPDTTSNMSVSPVGDMEATASMSP